MPVKNTADFLNHCIDSIVNQDYQNWELITVNDHSDDSSLEILRAYSANDSRIHVFQNEKEGIIPALRLALSKSRGKYITRMDSDDLMANDKIRLMVEALQTERQNSLAVGYVSYFSDQELGAGYRKYEQWLNNLTRERRNFEEIYRECTIPSPCWMTDRSSLEKCGAFDSNVYPEDYDLAFRFKKAGLLLAPIEKVLHHWRDWPKRSSRTDDNYSDNRFSNLKVLHFLDQDRDPNKTLVLWGAGNKGKQIAKELINSDATFKWITNNPKKIESTIFDLTLVDEHLLTSSEVFQVIIAISSPNDQVTIKLMKSRNDRHEYFHFC